MGTYYKKWTATANSKDEAQAMARAFTEGHKGKTGPVYVSQALDYDQETDTIGDLREWYYVRCGYWKEYDS